MVCLFQLVFNNLIIFWNTLQAVHSNNGQATTYTLPLTVPTKIVCGGVQEVSDISYGYAEGNTRMYIVDNSTVAIYSGMPYNIDCFVFVVGY